MGTRFLLMFLFAFCTGCMNYKSEMLDFSTMTMWESDPCGDNTKAKLVDWLLSHSVKELKIKVEDVENWFGEPIHKRIYLSGNISYVYHFNGSKKSNECPLGELFVLTFNKRGKLLGRALYFITESIELTKYWYSEDVPRESFERNESSNSNLEFIPEIDHTQ
jgi:hypothetical protein